MSDLELLRAIEQGRIDHEVGRRADEMLRLAIIFLRRLGGETVITFDEIASDTSDVDLVYTRSAIADPLDGTRVWLEASQKRRSAHE